MVIFLLFEKKLCFDVIVEGSPSPESVKQNRQNFYGKINPVRPQLCTSKFLQVSSTAMYNLIVYRVIKPSKHWCKCEMRYPN